MKLQYYPKQKTVMEAMHSNAELFILISFEEEDLILTSTNNIDKIAKELDLNINNYKIINLCSGSGHYVDNFLSDIITVYKKHNLSLAHEDAEGSFVVQEYSEDNVNWLLNAKQEI